MSAPACASPSRRWPPKNSAFRPSASRSSTATPALCPDQGGTGGSTGLTRGGTDVRQAAATARQALLDARRRATEPAGARADDRRRRGASDCRRRGRRHRRARRRSPPRAAKSIRRRRCATPARYTVVGKPLPRPDVPDKCTGRHVYVQDFTLPGMLHARVIRPPAIGAKLCRWTSRSIRGIPDVRVVRIESFLAVVGRGRMGRGAGGRGAQGDVERGAGAARAATALERWTCASAPSTAIRPIVSRGDAAAAMAGAAKKLSATYFWPFQSHASLGPSCAVADVRADGATIWSVVAGHARPARRTWRRCSACRRTRCASSFSTASGSYGTNGGDHVAADAVLLSKTVGQPVRVQWTRQDEHGWDPEGPAAAARRAGRPRRGRPHRRLGHADVAADTRRRARARCSAADAAGIPQEHGQGAGAITQNGDPPYAGRQRPRGRALDEGHAAAARRTCARRARSPTCSRWKASPTSSPRPPASIRSRSA